jgi:hypothetical protein
MIEADRANFVEFANKMIMSCGFGETPQGGDLVNDLYLNFKSKLDETDAPETEAEARRVILSNIKKYAKNKKYHSGDIDTCSLYDEEGNAIEIKDDRAEAEIEAVENTEAALEFFDDTFEAEADKVNDMVQRLVKIKKRMEDIECSNLDDRTKAQKIQSILAGVRAAGFTTEHTDDFKECFRVLFKDAIRKENFA